MRMADENSQFRFSSLREIVSSHINTVNMEGVMVDTASAENVPDSSERLGPCEVCGSSEAKYTCPRCEVKTCCLACVNIHKKELECDGARNKLLFKPLSKFENLDLLSDYRLLEDVTRTVQEVKKNPVMRVPRYLPGALHSLGKASKDRGMRLHFLPRNFKRATDNTSRVFPTTPVRTVHWRIEWLFPQAGVRLISKKVPETLRLAEAISPLLDPDNDVNINCRDKMQFYFSAGIGGVSALMKVGEMERNRYHLLDLDTSLRGNLMKKSVVEFPTILIILHDHKYAFDIYDSDDEGEQWKGNWEVTPASSSSSGTPQKNPQNKNNFLFGGSDCSSEEEG